MIVITKEILIFCVFVYIFVTSNISSFLRGCLIVKTLLCRGTLHCGVVNRSFLVRFLKPYYKGGKMSVYLMHKVEGVDRLSRVLSWETHIVPVSRPRVLAAPSSENNVSLGLSLVAVVAFRDAAFDRVHPVAIMVDETCTIETIDDETDYELFKDKL